MSAEAKQCQAALLKSRPDQSSTNQGANHFDMDSHTMAAISMTGNLLDAVGGLYLAYDLLGGEKGILRILIRIVNYSILIGCVYGFVFGLRFAVVAGIGMGTAMGLQLASATHGRVETPRMIVGLAILRACTIGLASSFLIPASHSFVLALFVFAAGMILPRLGLSPGRIFVAGDKFSFTKKKLLFALLLPSILAVGIGAAGFIFGGEQEFIKLAVKVAVTVSFLTLLLGAFSPIVEWYADRLPLKTIGHVGAVLFIIGFFLQAVPNLIVLLDLNQNQFGQQTTAPPANSQGTLLIPQSTADKN